MSEKIILFTSNCFGEDRSAALIAKELKAQISEKALPGYKILGASLISEAEDYKKRGIDVLFSSEVPPSGGFPTRSMKGFFSDMFTGIIRNVRNFIQALKKIKDNAALAVVVGDVTLLFLTRRALQKTPILFLAPAKSDYIEPHYKIEEWFIRRNVDTMLTHDAFTANNLKSKGLNALFLGNPMMDELEAQPSSLKIKKGKPVVGLLPGSREEAYDNFMKILEIAELISEKKSASFLAALPSTLADEKIGIKAFRNGWDFLETKPFPILKKEKAEVILSRGIFPNVLEASDVIIGLAGTANEQAAGLGRPIVSFVGTGPQTTFQRIAEQERLLGEALKFIQGSPADIAEEVIYLLDHPKERERRGKAGIERMGPSGGAMRIAEFIMKLIADG